MELLYRIGSHAFYVNSILGVNEKQLLRLIFICGTGRLGTPEV